MSLHPNSDLSGERTSFRENSNYVLAWPLRPGWRAFLFLLPIIAISLGLAWEVIRVARATYLLDSVSSTDVLKAIQLDPGNSDLLHRLGMVYSFDPTQGNLPEAEIYLRQATQINPRHWDFWSDLGTTCDFLEDTKCSDDAFARAARLNPMNPALQWAIGNHFLLTDRSEKGFPYFRRLVELDPQYLENTFRLCLRATHDPQAIYTEVVSGANDSAARFAYLEFLSSTADYESAMKIWGQMISGPDRSPKLPLVKPFLDFLIDHNQIQNASTVWNDLQHAGVIPPAVSPQDDNLLYNGGFELPPLDAGFDWRLSDSPDLAIDLSDPHAFKDLKCLRIDFPIGRNAEYELVNQVVRIKPNTSYKLVAYVRSENLTSNSGPRLRVVEMGCESCTARTSDPTVGTTQWHPVEVDFMTQPQTQAVRISFWRPQDQISSRDITGTVWLDDVTLHAVEDSGADRKQARTR